MAMTAKGFITGISGGTEVAGTLSIAAPGALYAVDFSRQKQKNPTSELLPPAAADRASRRRLTKGKEQETIIINRSGGSTYPEEKSVQTSGASHVSRRVSHGDSRICEVYRCDANGVKERSISLSRNAIRSCR
jgi:hypothetical protein